MKQSTGLPTKFVEAFGANAAPGTIRTIPVASQIGIVNGAASLNDGFPPLTATALASGGVPPSIQDFNGILYQATAWNLWTAAAGIVPYDPTFQSAIGGYPLYAVVSSSTTTVLGRVWISTVDNNMTNPDTGGAGWLNFMLPTDVVQTVLNVQRTQIVADIGGATQSVPTNVTTNVTNYGSVTVQSKGGSTFTNGVLTVGSGDAGLWFLSFHARQTLSGTSGFSNGLYINGSTTPVITGGANGNSSGSATIHGTGARLLNLSAGNTVVVGIIQTTGSTVVFNDIYDFSAVRLGSS